eukprot:28975-Eustigmatos_ZCMA.PRE.1
MNRQSLFGTHLHEPGEPVVGLLRRARDAHATLERHRRRRRDQQSQHTGAEEHMLQKPVLRKRDAVCGVGEQGRERLGTGACSE